MHSWQTILKVAGEGGSIALYGLQQDNQNWILSRHIKEIDHEIENLGTIRSTSHIVQAWDEALSLIQRYHWLWIWNGINWRKYIHIQCNRS